MRLMLLIKYSPRITKMGNSNRCDDDESVLTTLNQQLPEYNGYASLQCPHFSAGHFSAHTSVPVHFSAGTLQCRTLQCPHFSAHYKCDISVPAFLLKKCRQYLVPYPLGSGSIGQ
uniref:Uncharacterized protein n=1 Tax=Globodera rostochiensis TaxID=31243 RepID=A0A914HA18_GLORO